MVSLKSSHYFCLLVAVLAFFLGSLEPVQAQDSRILSLDNDYAYELITNLQGYGYLSELSANNFPYIYSELLMAVEAVQVSSLSAIQQIWYKNLLELVGNSNKNADQVTLYFEGQTVSEVNTSRRKDYYRPLDSGVFLWPDIEINTSLQYKGFVLNAGPLFSLYYDQDPDGIDAVRRFYIRNNKAYVGYANKFMEFYAGRLGTHWGSYNHTAALISNNPVNYDKISMKFKSKYFQVSSVMGFLDNIDGDDNFTGEARDETSRKRYVAAKSVDWRPNKDLIISYRESVLFSGLNANPELKYFLPVFISLFESDNAPANEINNLLFGVGIWKRMGNLTVNAELIFDDLILFNNVEGVRESAETNTLSWVTDIRYSFTKVPLRLELTNELISYQSYNTDQPEGRYLYLNRGLATQFNDYIFTQLKADVFLDNKIRGLRVSPYFGVLLQGEQEINQDFSKRDENGELHKLVLTGTVEETYRSAFDIVYAPSEHMWLRLDLGLNNVFNKGHQLDATNTGFVGMFELGLRYRLKYSE